MNRNHIVSKMKTRQLNSQPFEEDSLIVVMLSNGRNDKARTPCGGGCTFYE